MEIPLKDIKTGSLCGKHMDWNGIKDYGTQWYSTKLCLAKYTPTQKFGKSIFGFSKALILK